MDEIIQTMTQFLLIALALILVIYICCAIFLNKLNKLVYGKGTPMAWIPIANVYLLGKLAVNKIVGWILVLCFFLSGKTTVEINGVEQASSLLPSSFSGLFSKIYSIAILALFICAIIRYVQLKKKIAKEMNNMMASTTTTSQERNLETPSTAPLQEKEIVSTSPVSFQTPQENIGTSSPSSSSISEDLQTKNPKEEEKSTHLDHLYR